MRLISRGWASPASVASGPELRESARGRSLAKTEVPPGHGPSGSAVGTKATLGDGRPASSLPCATTDGARCCRPRGLRRAPFVRSGPEALAAQARAASGVSAQVAAKRPSRAAVTKGAASSTSRAAGAAASVTASAT